MSDSRIAVFCLCLAVLAWFAPNCAFADTLRLAIQKTGTVAWEIAVMRAHGLDKQGGFTVKTLELASPEAGKIALRGGSADVIVADWLWVSRERALGSKLVFYPYSSALGAVMVPGNSSMTRLADLAVAINKLPNTIVAVREGARALDPGLDDMVHVFAVPRRARSDAQIASMMADVANRLNGRCAPADSP